MSAGVRTAKPPAGLAVRARRLRVDPWLLLAAPPTIFLVVVFAYPLVTIAARSFTDPTVGVDNYEHFFSVGVYTKTLLRTLLTSALVTVACVVIGYPYAYLMTIVSPLWRKLLIFFVLVPFWTSLLVRTYAWTILLQDTGVINDALIGLGIVDEPVSLIRTTGGVVIGMTQILLPFLVLPLYANLRSIDPSLMRAAGNLGARPAKAFWRVYVPLSLPGVGAGALIVFIYALGFYITPALLGSESNAMLSQLIVIQVSQLFNFGFGAAMATVMLAVVLLLVWVLARLSRVDKAYKQERG